MEVPFTSHIESRVLVTILDELRMVTNPFVNMRVYLRSVGRSVIITSLSDRREVSGYIVLEKDNTDEIIEGYFPLLIDYTFTPTEVLDEGGSVEVFIGNFSAKYFEDSVRIYSIKVNDQEMQESFIETISESKKYSIVVEAKGMTAYLEREVIFKHPTYVFFSPERNPRELEVPESHKLPNIPGLFYDGEIFHNDLQDEAMGFLWIVSAFKPEYVKTADGIEFAIEGHVYLVDSGVYYWRSDDMLNNGRWKLTIH